MKLFALIVCVFPPVYGCDRIHAAYESSPFVVYSGDSVSLVTKRLADCGWVKYPTLMYLIIRLFYMGDVKAGCYYWNDGISSRQIAQSLNRGSAFPRLRITGGMRSSQIERMIKKTDYMDGECPSIQEGSILPGEYHYKPGSSRADVVSSVTRDSCVALDKIWAERPSDFPLTKAQWIVLASIVEREGREDDYSKIAGVFMRRLSENMMLQSCSTLLYALERDVCYEDKVTHSHLNLDSEYNTYKVRGLPPTPICHPGSNALRATLNPSQDGCMYFFFNKKRGEHVFSETFAEHAKLRRSNDF